MLKIRETETSTQNFKSILEKCEVEDFNYLTKVLHSFIPLTKPGKIEALRIQLEQYPDIKKNKELWINEFDKQIRYFGSSNMAYIKRALMDPEAGNCASDIVDDVYHKLKISIKQGPSSIHTRLKRLVNKVVENELKKMKPKQLAKAFESIGMGDADAKLIMEKIQLDGKIAVLPILVKILGPEITLNIIETIVISIIAQVTGKEAAKHLTKEVIKRNPWINALGPFIWLMSGTWFAYDMQGPAFRKTVPICLYLGMVELRGEKEESHHKEEKKSA